ncbi:galactoside alpha-(1,2)-fucosyltransferase 1-like [Oratosquilla oratoria]|uniref:galactoside alpha-(1,2)-fucosyltransferase 1-like n=1 Tax=Oratosquilla oratoria TaxID=337810 RepID=UPI003F75D351
MICSESASRLRQRLVSDFTLANMNHSKIVALILMCSSSLYCLFYIKLRDVGDRNFRFNYMNLSFFEDWSSPPLRWVPVQNKSEYVGEMANATLPFLKLDSPETKELLDGNVDCSKPWVTIPTSGQLGSNVMQTFFVYNLRFKHKLQAGMTRPMWDYLRKVFPYTHHRLLPPDCLKQLKGMKKVTHNTIIGELAKKDGQRRFLAQPAIHPLDELWYLRKVLIEEFRFAEHILVEARLVLENLLDKWRQRMSTIEPQRLRQSEPGAVVGVHVRRTDKAQEIKKVFHTTLISPAYFHLAIASARKMFDNVAFVVLTDDMEWTHQNLLTAHPDAVLQDMPSKRDTDLAIMSLCDHVITSVGNFGFLGGWLSGGKIFYPEAIFKGKDRSLPAQAENSKRYNHFIAISYNQTN